MIRTLIVDDERLARQRIRELLDGVDGFTVEGECEDGLQAIESIEKLRPDLVFLDVQMPGLSGFEVLEHLEPPAPLIVFTTAYETYALRAFEVSAVDYVLKPIDEERFRKATDRARAALSGPREGWSARLNTLLSRLEQRDQSMRRILVKSGGRVFLVDVRDIDWFEAAGNYVRIHTGGLAHLIRTTMHALEEKLDRRMFARVHRSTIVNVARISELQSESHGDYVTVLKSGVELELARAYRQRLQAVIEEF